MKFNKQKHRNPIGNFTWVQNIIIQIITKYQKLVQNGLKKLIFGLLDKDVKKRLKAKNILDFEGKHVHE